MAEGVDIQSLTASLKRLSKEDLVQVIIKKRLESESASGQEKLKSAISQHLSQTPNGNTESEMLKMENQCLKREIVLLNQSVNDLQYTIQLQKDAIDNLKKNQNHNLALPSNVVIQKNSTTTNSNRALEIINQVAKQYFQVVETTKPHQEMARQNNQNNNKENGGSNESKQSDYKTVLYKKPQKRYPKVVGNNVLGNLKGVARRQSIYISRLDTETTEEEIKTHFKENGITSCEIKMGNSKHPEIYKSYIITVPETIIEKVKKPELWPEGASISNFLYKRQNQTRIEKKNSA
ncbi:unnamed protein product [Brassicogethes aeneus]|uniref:Uncharacterized protein n=1 Tax=Brassicogethes aeneus TaxID=1431903 RepID=A0A9P0FMX9_BRAAE|nr:unnamed protein product [Brassicogethes aeneus]